jgi:hypothetical protein
MAALKVVQPRTLQTQGSLEGLGLRGTFHTWRDGTKERYDEALGLRVQRTLRLNGVEYAQNANGDVRVFHGLAARRQITEDFIDSGAFAHQPEYATPLGPGKLADGRDVWQLRVTPPGGEPYDIALDTSTWMIDEQAFAEGDSVTSTAFSDYRVVDGALVPFVEVDSSGDREFDLTSHVESVRVNDAIDASVFAPFASTVVDAAGVITVPLLYDKGHAFVRGSVEGRPLLLLVDSGAQGIFLDPGAAQRLGLTTEGQLEIRGVKRTKGLGVAALDRIEIGGANLPVHVVSVVDLSSVSYQGVTADGVLGYPFFAAAEVRVDPERYEMTIAKPGTLKARGTPIAIDTDRELPEATAKINNVEGRFLLDTGNTTELLVFHRFVDANPGLIFYGTSHGFASNRGVGGSSQAVKALINELDLGPFRLFNRYADVMLADTGAFADRNDAGNIGMGSLRNFVFTFDFVNRTLFLDPTRSFDDGRGRQPLP